MLIRMPDDVDTKDIDAVCEESDRIYRSIYPDADPRFVPWACGWFRTVFGGRYADYQPLDVPYHDLEHTMQGLLCLVRVLYGRHQAGAQPHVPRRAFVLGILAILLHDSGYLKRGGDTDGTGAKYTLIHVDRSRAFAGSFLREQGYSSQDIEAVQSEFRESCHYFGEPADRLRYESPEALIANTPNFWQAYVKPKLDQGCQGMYRFLNDPYPDGDNEYLDRIEANITKAARMAGN